ncbi:DUF305 domain-containing protein [Streptomyces sp. NPDC046985]|uniref:DUF305 domain-containing protein n=1 Tax=Streptomyces sp. NPDC046985 TaxID=3155377 RepID=UPI0033E7E878
MTAAVVLSACGGGGAAPGRPGPSGSAWQASRTADGAAPSGHNAQDVAFARQMIPHHRQALAMAALVPQRAGSRQVRELAERIRKAQAPEIAEMSGWLRAWGAQAPDAEAPGMPGMPSSSDDSSSDGSSSGRSGSPAPGMMPDADMAGLRKLSGDAFDRAFLRMMIGHHEGAVAMARTERDEGAYGPAAALAKSVAAGQSSEIAEMKRLLGER